MALTQGTHRSRGSGRGAAASIGIGTAAGITAAAGLLFVLGGHFAQGFLQAAWEVQDKAFQLIRDQHLEQLPMHEFLLRIRAQLLWAWARLDEAEGCGMQAFARPKPQA